MAAHLGDAEDAHERALVEQGAYAIAARFQVTLADAYRHLGALAQEFGISMGEAAEALVGGRPPIGSAHRPGPASFDPAKYLRRPPHELPGSGTVQPEPIPEPPEPPEWVDDVLAGIHGNALYAMPLYSGGRINDFVIVRINDTVESRLGEPARQAVGRRLQDAYPQVLTSGLLGQYIRAFETGEPFARGPFEQVTISPRGLEPVSVVLRAARAGPGLLLTWSDTAEEERLLARWEQSERLAGLGWGEWNLFTNEVEWTRRMYDIFGRTPEEGPTRLEEMPGLLLPEDLPAMEEAVRTLFEYREAVDTEFRIRQRSGVRHVHMMLEPVLDSDARPVAVRFLAQDVTDRRRQERVLAATHQRLLEENRRAEEERRFAARLRQVILALRDPAISAPGMDVAVRYHTAERIGGDWHKARPLPDGRVLLAIGDAMGHGLAAATQMAQMRAGLAGLAYTGAEPGRLMTWLNELVRAEPSGEVGTGTAVLGHFLPEDRTLRWSRAGHPPPILVRAGRARLLEGEGGPMLGVLEDPRYPVSVTALEPHDLLLFYTDGIIDRRDMDPDTATARLLAAAAGADGSPDDRLDRIIKEIGADQMEDDVCLMAAVIR
ncbi:SpoIIE family protein phosphatase [Thermomonospora cellulosilytica]|uniref:Serine phosphatase RsbU (Regulator of sigma subunit) n=1 Tax=Thermomonospora cellulosilytica TaxID=1411118 RepID=A0A7W3RAA1_9ACTN|nr:SpoIIE family protein phosphatase [Thermomonospora cellulosilytica]MBA9006178.1 serine phosphatase RsbU (regulator of sigma subunit) [Thermomonospora cellulosilytica]